MAKITMEATYPTIEIQVDPLQTLRIDIQAEGALLRIIELDEVAAIQLTTEQAIEVAKILYYELYPSLMNNRPQYFCSHWDGVKMCGERSVMLMITDSEPPVAFSLCKKHSNGDLTTIPMYKGIALPE